MRLDISLACAGLPANAPPWGDPVPMPPSTPPGSPLALTDHDGEPLTDDDGELLLADA